MTSVATPKPHANLDELLAPTPPPFALLHRPESTDGDQLDILVGAASAAHRLADLRLPPHIPSPGGSRSPRHELLAVVPYRQVRERGYACHDDGTPILTMSVTDQGQVPVSEALRRLPDTTITLSDTGFDIDDDTYGATVRRILTDEIGTGAGSNFVIKRAFTATIPNYSPHVALSLFRRLLVGELGAYCTFIVHIGSHTFVGASPERHVSLRDGTVVMNPISGTYRYPHTGPDVSEVLSFLADRKEADELYMVVDEELKMMARICESGGRVVGPYLKEMARLAHTEYILEGRSALDVRDILRETMFAPTVTGSPLENACRVLARHEPAGRGYYSGVLALIGRDSGGQRTLDSSILIRSADIDASGRLQVGVGATLVRHSDPHAEIAETWAKAASVLTALGVDTQASGGGAATAPGTHAPTTRLGDRSEVRSALELRNAFLSRHWLERSDRRDRVNPTLSGLHALVVDAEDTFTSMLAHELRALGLAVSIHTHDQVPEAVDEGFDLVVVGPGPGDPTDRKDPRIATLRNMTHQLLASDLPFISVCLGHQVLASLLGLRIESKEMPNQGVQKEIDLFGSVQRVGFYNTFYACTDEAGIHSGMVGAVEVSRDLRTGEVYALRGPGFASAQFHPESILTQHGVDILGDFLCHAVAERGSRRSPSGRARRTEVSRQQNSRAA